MQWTVKEKEKQENTPPPLVLRPTTNSSEGIFGPNSELDEILLL